MKTGTFLFNIFCHLPLNENVSPNLLLGQKNELHNRALHISAPAATQKVDIDKEKVDIETEEVDIQNLLSQKAADFTVKTIVHIHRMFDLFGYDGVFGRSAVAELLELRNSSSSKLLSKLSRAGIIEPVLG